MNNDMITQVGTDLGSTAAYVAQLIGEAGEEAAREWADSQTGYYTRRNMLNLVATVAARVA